jgi:dTDP-4-dehydrorhamnose reductase
MKILIAGAAGQLGRSLPAVLPEHEIIARSRGALDITDLSAVRAAVVESRAEVVVNAAAWNRVDDAEADVHGAFRVNAVGPRNLALAAAENDAAIVHVSTDYVFDGAKGCAYVESDTPCPRSVYGASKLAGEDAVRSVNTRHHIVRTAWVFHEEGNNFPRTMIRLAEKGPLRVVNDQIGSPTYAPHLAAGVARMIESEAFGTWHLAGAGAVSWYELTVALFARLGIDTPVEPTTTDAFPRPALRPAFSALASERTPRITLPAWQEGLAAFCDALPQ